MGYVALQLSAGPIGTVVDAAAWPNLPLALRHKLVAWVPKEMEEAFCEAVKSSPFPCSLVGRMLPADCQPYRAALRAQMGDHPDTTEQDRPKKAKSVPVKAGTKRTKKTTTKKKPGKKRAAKKAVSQDERPGEDVFPGQTGETPVMEAAPEPPAEVPAEA